MPKLVPFLAIGDSEKPDLDMFMYNDLKSFATEVHKLVFSHEEIIGSVVRKVDALQADLNEFLVHYSQLRGKSDSQLSEVNVALKEETTDCRDSIPLHNMHREARA